MPPNTKECPYCAENIKAAAIVCRYCGRDLPPGPVTAVPARTRRRGQPGGSNALFAAFLGAMFTLACCGLLTLVALLLTPTTFGSASARRAAADLLQPVIVRPTAPPIETILAAGQDMTNAQRSAYNDSLRGSRVEGWRGVVADVYEGEFLGGFVVYVDMVDGNLYPEAQMDVAEDVALGLDKGQAIVFSGEIADVSAGSGGTVFIENATIVPVD